MTEEQGDQTNDNGGNIDDVDLEDSPEVSVAEEFEKLCQEVFFNNQKFIGDLGNGTKQVRFGIPDDDELHNSYISVQFDPKTSPENPYVILYEGYQTDTPFRRVYSYRGGDEKGIYEEERVGNFGDSGYFGDKDQEHDYDSEETSETILAKMKAYEQARKDEVEIGIAERDKPLVMADVSELRRLVAAGTPLETLFIEVKAA